MTALVAAAAIAMALQSGIDTIARDSMSQVDTAMQQTARTEQEWAKLWRAHAGDGKAPPKVDFTTRMVVAVFLGSRPTAGYAVEITDAKVEGQLKTLIVEWRERRPDSDSILAQVITSPAHIVSVPKSAGTVNFRKVDR